MASVEELSDTAFIERMLEAHEQNPLFRHKPDNIARLYRLAGMHHTADQFASMVERICLPNLAWAAQQARAALTGIAAECYEPVMAERALIVSYLRDVHHNTIGDVARQRLDEAIKTIESGEHRALVKPAEPGQLIEERDV